MILIDTNVWVSFFKGEKKAALLRDLIMDNAAIVHPWVLGELLLGGLATRAEELLGSLEAVDVADYRLVCDFIQTHSLKSRGIGWVDVNLLVSALLGKHQVFTFDQNLIGLCREFGCSEK